VSVHLVTVVIGGLGWRLSDPVSSPTGATGRGDVKRVLDILKGGRYSFVPVNGNGPRVNAPGEVSAPGAKRFTRLRIGRERDRVPVVIGGLGWRLSDPVSSPTGATGRGDVKRVLDILKGGRYSFVPVNGNGPRVNAPGEVSAPGAKRFTRLRIGRERDRVP
jgi:hypothetical protein